jgi:hypothetical protein
MRAASAGIVACAASLALALCLPVTSLAQRGGMGARGGHFGFSGSSFGGGSHFSTGGSFHGSIGGGGFRPSGISRNTFVGGNFHSGGFFHKSFRHHSGTSFFFGLSFGGYYPYYPYYYDPFWYPDYAYYPYPAYRTVYVDEPVYVERRYRGPDEKYGDDEYYLHRRYSSAKPEVALSDAVADIETAFLKGDAPLLERHIETRDSIRIYARDRSTKSVKGSEYFEMTRDAMKDMKTVSYHLDRIQPAGGGAWSASGIHVLRAENGDEKRFEVNFVFRKTGDRWVIAEAGASAIR